MTHKGSLKDYTKVCFFSMKTGLHSICQRKEREMSVHQNPNDMNAKYEFKNINKELHYSTSGGVKRFQIKTTIRYVSILSPNSL